MARALSSAAPLNLLGRGHNFGRRSRIFGAKTAQNLVRGVLEPGIWLVQLTGCLAR